jgi:hypothetical protein
MVFGGIEHERLQLNEDTLWAGGPYDPSHAAAAAAARALIATAPAGRAVDHGAGSPGRRARCPLTVCDVTITWREDRSTDIADLDPHGDRSTVSGWVKSDTGTRGFASHDQVIVAG